MVLVAMTTVLLVMPVLLVLPARMDVLTDGVDTGDVLSVVIISVAVTFMLFVLSTCNTDDFCCITPPVELLTISETDDGIGSNNGVDEDGDGNNNDDDRGNGDDGSAVSMATELLDVTFPVIDTVDVAMVTTGVFVTLCDCDLFKVLDADVSMATVVGRTLVSLITCVIT